MSGRSSFPHDIQDAIGAHDDHCKFAGRAYFLQRRGYLQTKEFAALRVNRYDPPAVARLEQITQNRPAGAGRSIARTDDGNAVGRQEYGSRRAGYGHAMQYGVMEG